MLTKESLCKRIVDYFYNYSWDLNLVNSIIYFLNKEDYIVYHNNIEIKEKRNKIGFSKNEYFGMANDLNIYLSLNLNNNYPYYELRDDMIIKYEKAFGNNFSLCNNKTKAIMVIIFTLFHELGHFIYFKKLQNRGNFEKKMLRREKLKSGRREKIIQIQLSNKKLSLKSAIMKSYTYSFVERNANKYAIKTIQKFIKDGIIDVNNLNKILKNNVNNHLQNHPYML